MFHLKKINNPSLFHRYPKPDDENIVQYESCMNHRLS
jgi:hypothetical protein